MEKAQSDAGSSVLPAPLDLRVLSFQTRSTALLFKRQAKMGRPSQQLNYLVHQAWALIESLDILPKASDKKGFLDRSSLPSNLGAEIRATLEALEEGQLQKDLLQHQATLLERLASNLDRVPA